MQNGEQTFLDANGDPLSGGKVYMYIPSTTTFKNTWQDEGETILNANPIVLDAAGRCIIYGNGKYRQYLTDQFGTLVWDQLTNWVNVPALTVTSVYDLPIYIQGKPSVGEVFPIFNAVRSVKLPAGLVASIFTVATVPTAPAVFTLAKNAITIGTVSFATSGVPTVSFVSDVSFAPGDQLIVTAPNPQDSTMANVAMTFVMTVL
jgi:hypothetical protein